MHVGDWICCFSGKGYQIENGDVSIRERHFPENSVGRIESLADERATIWLIGRDERWEVKTDSVKVVDVTKTGDNFDNKICNMCHCFLPVAQFAKNQIGRGDRTVRRPSCIRCRTDIDKRPPKTMQSKRMEKDRPKMGDSFRCPICRKRSIAGVTAKIVADHNHHTGDIRDFICESCNTGLGRFKNGEDYLQNAIRYLEERDI